MVNPIRRLTTYGDGSFLLEDLSEPVPPLDIPEGYELRRVLHDLETGSEDLTFTYDAKRFKRNGIRRKAPEVFNMELSRQFDMNPGVLRIAYDLFKHFASRLGKKTLDRFYNLYGPTRAFTNAKGGGRGFSDETPCADYNFGTNLTYPPARWDDYHICGGATLLCKQVGKLLEVVTIDTNNVPTLEEILKKPYLYFFALTNGVGGRPFDFPQGSISEADIYDPVAIPLMSDHSKGPVYYPTHWTEHVDRIANPYNIVT